MRVQAEARVEVSGWMDVRSWSNAMATITCIRLLTAGTL
jgi:hypothetical protein